MNEEQYSNLDSEIKKIWARVVELEKLPSGIATLTSKLDETREIISKEPYQYIKEAASYSKNASQFYNRIKNKCDDLEKRITQYDEQGLALNELLLVNKELNTTLKGHVDDVSEKMSAIDEDYNHLLETRENRQEKENEITSDLEKSQEQLQSIRDIKEKMVSVDEESDGVFKKIKSLHAEVIGVRNEVKQTSNEIFGYEEQNEETGETLHVDGMKEQLEKAYVGIEQKLKNFGNELDEFKQTKETAYSDFLESRAKEYSELKAKIEKLLPNALTAGLSHAYAEKTAKEESEKKWATGWFIGGLVVMLIATFIPLGLFAYCYVQLQMTFLQVVDLAPKFALLAMPVYCPLLWFAYFTNKRIKLSKRLIEEYAHKEALSKTFEGLSRQIDNLEDEKMSLELRARLLYNILSTSAENPGKLIYDYEKTDNPILEILDKSVKLGESMEKLQKMPLINKVIEMMLKSQTAKSDKLKQSAINGLSAVDSQESDRESNDNAT